jgi:hypothetical protein
MKYKKYELEIYKAIIHIYFVDDIEKEAHRVTDNYNSGKASAMSGRMEAHGNYFMMFDEKDFNYSIAAHEASHIVSEIFNHIGAKKDTNNDEPECYLLEWLVKKIEETK